MKRIIVVDDAKRVDTLKMALAYSVKLGDAVHAVILLTHTKSQLFHTSLADDLGQAVTKSLSDGKPVNFGPSHSISHRTLQTLKHNPTKAVLIAYYAEAKMMDFVDSLDNLVAVICVPERLEEVENWRARWGVQVHGLPNIANAAILNIDQKTENALNFLDKIVNRISGIGDPRDKKAAEEIFRILKNKGHVLEGEAIKSHVIRLGWSPDNASKLGALAMKIEALKAKPSLTNIYNASERYNQW